jgi:hypothetical protein
MFRGFTTSSKYIVIAETNKFFVYSNAQLYSSEINNLKKRQRATSMSLGNAGKLRVSVFIMPSHVRT